MEYLDSCKSLVSFGNVCFLPVKSEKNPRMPKPRNLQELKDYFRIPGHEDYETYIMVQMVPDGIPVKLYYVDQVLVRMDVDFAGQERLRRSGYRLKGFDYLNLQKHFPHGSEVVVSGYLCEDTYSARKMKKLHEQQGVPFCRGEELGKGSTVFQCGPNCHSLVKVTNSVQEMSSPGCQAVQLSMDPMMFVATDILKYDVGGVDQIPELGRYSDMVLPEECRFIRTTYLESHYYPGGSAIILGNNPNLEILEGAIEEIAENLDYTTLGNGIVSWPGLCADEPDYVPIAGVIVGCKDEKHPYREPLYFGLDELGITPSSDKRIMAV